MWKTILIQSRIFIKKHTYMGVADTVISGAETLGNLATSFYAASQQRKEAKLARREQYEYQRKLNQEAFDNSRMAAQEAREWDSAGQQIQRMTAAGLNPYANANGAAVSSSPSPSPEAPSGSASAIQANVAGPLSANPIQMSQARYYNALADKLVGETVDPEDSKDLIRSKIKANEAAASRDSAQAAYTSYENSFNKMMEETRIDIMKQEYDNLCLEGGKILAETTRIDTDTTKIQAQIDLLVSERLLAEVKIRAVEAGIRLTDQQIKNLQDELENNQQLRKLWKAETDELVAREGYLEELTDWKAVEVVGNLAVESIGEVLDFLGNIIGRKKAAKVLNLINQRLGQASGQGSSSGSKGFHGRK